MPIGSMLLGLALLLPTMLFVVRPFVKERPRQPEKGQGKGGLTPESAKHSALIALRDLEFDFRTGKITEEDYAPVRQQLLVEAAQAVQLIEAAHSDRDLDAKLEAAIGAVRAVLPTTPRPVCPQCHRSARADDKFCSKCGGPLTVEVVSV